MRRIENEIKCRHEGGVGLCELNAHGHCLGYMRVYNRERYKDPSLRASHLAHYTRRYHRDKKFREKVNKYTRKYQTDNAEKLREYEREKYRTNRKYRAAQVESARKRYHQANKSARNKRQRERYRSDPAFRERVRQQNRESYARKKARGRNGAVTEGDKQ